MEKIILLLVSIMSSNSVLVNWTQTSWDSADKFCSDIGRHLYTIQNLDELNSVTLKINISGDATFWIGGKERRKFFLWNNDKKRLVDEPIGCFQSELKNSQRFLENQPTLCISFCKHHLQSAFAGLSGKKCLCYHNLHYVKQDVDIKCNVSCPGDKNYQCGGPKMTTVYRTDDSIKWKIYEPHTASEREDCVWVTQDNEKQLIWHQDRCRFEHKYICRIFDKTICKFRDSLTLPCYYMSPEQTTWFEAVRRCRGMGGHLAGKDLIREDNVTLSGSSFWTSLTRIRQKWIDGRRVNDVLPRYEESDPRRTGCLSLEQRNDEWSIRAKPCGEDHPFLCSSALHSPQDIVSLTHEKVMHQIFDFDLFIGVVASIIGVCVVVTTLCCCKYIRRSKRQVQPLEPEHFYFILEKESVYNTISLNTCAQGNLTTNKNDNYYDCLAFNGSVQHSEREKYVSCRSDIDYQVYSRTSDITTDYDVLQFGPLTRNRCLSSENYFTLPLKCDIQQNYQETNNDK
ncbi:uncharacterized protein LOC143064115 [Mytilus galloprovincialis]|uniref:uncharacterized protein LOC143064115 n=1 Tax=Mytilus galloprovincialis TaxID=29158 RepID=UPI003F7B5B2B